MRARFQNGSVVKVNKRAPMWAGKYLDAELQPDGSLKRVWKTKRLGPIAEMTRKQAERALSKIVTPINSESYRPKQKDQTIRAAYEKWLRVVLPKYKPSSRASLKSNLQKMLPDFGRLDYTTVKSDRVQDWINRLAATGEYGNRTLRNYLSAFETFWEDLRAWEYVTTNPFHRVSIPVGPKTVAPHFTLDQAREILIRANTEPYRTMFAILAETGMRGGELCGLFTSDVDLDARTIKIARSSYQGHIQTTKTANADRTVHISGHLVARIKEYLSLAGCDGHDWMKPKTAEGVRVPRPSGTSPANSLLFPYTKSPTGLAWDNADIVADGLNPVLEEMGIKEFRMGLHAFRHACSDLMLELGIPEKYRNERRGHSTGSGKMDQIYSRGNVARHQEYAEKIGRALFDPKKPVRSETEQMALAMGAD